MMPCIVLPVSRPPNVTEKTACTQMKGGIPRYVFSTSSPLCNIGQKNLPTTFLLATFFQPKVSHTFLLATFFLTKVANTFLLATFFQKK